MIEQFYFPDPSREECTPIEKTDEDFYPKYVSHSPFLDEIEKGFTKSRNGLTPMPKMPDALALQLTEYLKQDLDIKDASMKKVAKNRVKKDK